MQTPKGNLVKNWIPDELAWIGFVFTAIIGGIVGFIKAYEQSAVELTKRAIAWGILRRSVMAGFAGWLVYQLTLIYGLSNAWGHVLAGITGVFASEAFEVAWFVVKTRITAMTGAKEPPK